MYWKSSAEIPPREYVCGHCNRAIASNKGYVSQVSPTGHYTGYNIYICPNCSAPSIISKHVQIPGIAYGEKVEHLPDTIKGIYEEARRAYSTNCFTASVLICRKLLMHIAVNEGAKEGQNFIAYIEYLSNKGFVPPNGKAWVDHIRKKGNEANHEITEITQTDAEELITFSGMLLKFMYEFHAKIPKAASS